MTKLKCRYFKNSMTSTRKLSDSFCIYNSKDFPNIPRKICRPNKSGYTVVKVIGKNLPRLTDWEIEFTGEWRENQKYGYTFFADSHHLLSPSTEKGIEKFLCSKTFPGIGEKTAKAIVNEFKLQTLNIIENSPNQLLRINGITLEKVGLISECYKKNIAFSKLSAYLATFGISQNIAVRVYDRYEALSLGMIKDNPYVLQNIRGIGFQTCEKIARVEGVALDSFMRIEGAMIDTLRTYCESSGNMFMSYDAFENKTLKVLNELSDVVVSTELFRKAAKKASNNKDIVFRNKKFVFLKEYDRAEDTSAKKIASLMQRTSNNSFDAIEKEILDYVKTSSIRLSDGQVDAVMRSLRYNISIITGGPGTGKTTILKAVINVYHRLNPNKHITLLAPTGKAAARMAQSCDHEASTIHSKLQIYEDYVSNPIMIEEGLIVVDETSMVDNLLLEKLLNSITASSQIVFVGDVDQLPSVGAGACLQEMIASGIVPVSKLTEIFRQKDDCTIIDNANAVNEGRNELVYDNSFELLTVDNEEDAIGKIETLYESEVTKYGAENVALLSPLRRTQNGRYSCVSDALNAKIQEKVNPSTGISVIVNGTEFRVGDRILNWRNTKEINNGDVGEVTNIDQNDKGYFLEVKWDNGKETVEDRDSLIDMTLAYALSVHKSQGSEYESVIIPMLGDQVCPLFKQNLLYTALTRAKKHVILVADEAQKAIAHCIANSDTNKRNTLLSVRIRNYAGAH